MKSDLSKWIGGFYLAALLLASPMLLGWTEQGGTAGQCTDITGGKGCYLLFNGATTPRAISFKSGVSGKICLDPDITTSGAATAQVVVHVCPFRGKVNLTREADGQVVEWPGPSLNTCEGILANGTLDGAAGTVCVWDLPSTSSYLVEVTQAPTGQNALLWAELQ